jgi:hypothetical protein
VRTLLFQRLLREDPRFARHFMDVVSETLSDSLTADYLGDLVRRYEMLSVRDAPFGGFDLRTFFARRADEVFDAVARALGQPRPHSVRIQAPAGVGLEVDGRMRSSSYVGRYFDGQAVAIRALGKNGRPIGAWDVNGRRSLADLGGEPLRVVITADTSISAAY